MTWTTPPPDGARGARLAEAVPGLARHHHAPLPAGAHVADRRGLTATGAVVLAGVLGLLGAVVDLTSGSTLGTAFEVTFVLGTAVAAALVHREDLKAAVVVAPYTYCALAVVASFFSDSGAAGGVVRRTGVALLDALVVHAPVLFLATGLALVIVLVRRARARQA